MNMDSSLLYYLCYDPTLSRVSHYTVEPLYCGHQFMGLTTACVDFGGFRCIFGRRGNAYPALRRRVLELSLAVRLGERLTRG